MYPFAVFIVFRDQRHADQDEDHKNQERPEPKFQLLPLVNSCSMTLPIREDLAAAQ